MYSDTTSEMLALHPDLQADMPANARLKDFLHPDLHADMPANARLKDFLHPDLQTDMPANARLKDFCTQTFRLAIVS